MTGGITPDFDRVVEHGLNNSAFGHVADKLGVWNTDEVTIGSTSSRDYAKSLIKDKPGDPNFEVANVGDLKGFLKDVREQIKDDPELRERVSKSIQKLDSLSEDTLIGFNAQGGKQGFGEIESAVNQQADIHQMMTNDTSPANWSPSQKNSNERKLG